MEKVRVVLDTNVWVAAGFRRHSASARLVERIRVGQVHLVWDNAPRYETKRVLSTRSGRTKSGQNEPCRLRICEVWDIDW